MVWFSTSKGQVVLDLTFAKVIKITQGIEIMRDNLKQMQSPATAGKQVVADAQQVEQKPCYRCGQSGHEASRCPHMQQMW